MDTEKDSDTVHVKRVKHGCKKTKGMTMALIFVADWVKEKRLKRNFSQSTLGKKVGVGKRTIMDIESHLANPKFQILYGLVRELKIPIYQIFYPEIPEEFEERTILFKEIQDCSDKEMKIILPMVRELREVLREEKQGRKNVKTVEEKS